jgi:hypothetical protein
VPWETGVKVTWSPSEANGSPVSGYTVRVEGTGGPYEKFVDSAADLEAVFDNLVHGSTYEVTVWALSSKGSSEEVKAEVATHVLPAAPTVVAGVPGDRLVTVSWTPGSTDASTITSYTVEHSSNAGVSWTTSARRSRRPRLS